MTQPIHPYPLHWPEGRPRPKKREESRFKATLSAAFKNVEDSVRRFGSDSGVPVKGVVITSNVALGAGSPADPGVCIWL